MFEINNTSEWSRRLGLLPIRLFADGDDSYILLNGGIGDFCLEPNSTERQDEYYFSASWSSNTKNFVSVTNDSVIIYNWINKRDERISLRTVVNNYEKFYEYLVYKSTQTEYDLVPYVLSIFRKLRNLINEATSGADALNLLFLLLAAYEDDLSIDEIDKEKWGLENPVIPDNELEKYIEEFSKGISAEIRPNVELILRHASGILFQEAQREVLYFDKSLHLFTSTLSGNYLSKPPQDSSIHYTPSYLARTIVENSLDRINLNELENLKILDPACGSSEFLMEALKQLKSRGYSGRVQVIGKDSSLSAVTTSRFLLKYEQREWAGRLSFDVQLVNDSLRENWGNDFDLILMNPPFLSWEQMDKDSRHAVLDVLRNFSEKRPNQASAFFYRAVTSLRDGGVVGTVIPTSVLTLDSYNKLRSAINDELTLSLIGKLGNFVFQDAVTDVSILVGARPKDAGTTLLLWTRNQRGVVADALRDLRKLRASSLPSVESDNHSIYYQPEFPLSHESWKPISLSENRLFQRVEDLVKKKVLTRVKNVFSVQQGARTGNNLIFKISESTYNSLPQAEQIYFRPVVDNDAVKSNFLVVKNFIWYPYDYTGMIFQDERSLEERVPVFFQSTLLPNKEKLSSGARQKLEYWWGLDRYRTWQVEKFPKLVSTEFGKSDSFAFDKAGDFIVERGNAWLPKKNFSDLDDFYFYLAILSSPFFDKLLSIYSRQLAGGKWYDLGKKFTKDIPIVNVSKQIKESGTYERLVEFGQTVASGGFVDLVLLEKYVRELIYHFAEHV